MAPSCAWSVFRSKPCDASQILRDPPADPAARSRESGENATAPTHPPGPLSVNVSLLSAQGREQRIKRNANMVEFQNARQPLKALGLSTSLSSMVKIAAGLFSFLAGLESDVDVAPADVLLGIRSFFERTAVGDGSFRPGTNPQYRGMSDSAASDIAP